MDQKRTEQVTEPVETNSEAKTPSSQAERDELRELAAERDKYLDLFQRSQAEFDNYQKRNRRELEVERQFALWPLARDILPILDNLERALASVNQESTLSQGVRMVHNQFLETLKRHHIRQIDALQKPFDPNQHEAVMEQPTPDQPAGTVLQVLEPGYLYHDRVLRPAKVIVARAGN